MTILLVQLFRNQLLLVTPKAIYSYGTCYDPFRKIFKQLKNELPNVKTFLLLGTGLGSGLKILQETYHRFPQTTLIDNDEDVLALSIKWMNLNTHNNVEWQCADAMNIFDKLSMQYDLIGVDVFRELVQPDFTLSEKFITSCNLALTPHGICVMNMILSDDNKIANTERKLKRHFSKVNFILDKVNTYFICYK